MSDCIKTVYTLCSDYGYYEGTVVQGVYDDITLAKQAAIVHHIETGHREYVIHSSEINTTIDDDCDVDFIVDEDTIVAYGVKSV